MNMKGCSLPCRQLKAISLDTMNDFYSKWEQIGLAIIKLDFIKPINDFGTEFRT